MDPNETLRQMRAAWIDGDFVTVAHRAADLDEWLSQGGFLPDDWKRNV